MPVSFVPPLHLDGGLPDDLSNILGWSDVEPLEKFLLQFLDTQEHVGGSVPTSPHKVPLCPVLAAFRTGEHGAQFLNLDIDHSANIMNTSKLDMHNTVCHKADSLISH